MTPADLAALILFLAPLAYSPGPGNLFFAATGARFGLRFALPALTGYHVATIVVTFAIGLGFAGASSLAPQFLPLLRLAGTGYIFWLALGFLRAGLNADSADPVPVGFSGGGLILLLNPKAYLIIILMFSQFHIVSPAASLALSVAFTANNLVAFLAYTLAGDRLMRSLRRRDRARWIDIAFALVLALTGLWLFLR
jgi:threonine/homoserine/homoserine lactone efflux protein